MFLTNGIKDRQCTQFSLKTVNCALLVWPSFQPIFYIISFWEQPVEIVNDRKYIFLFFLQNVLRELEQKKPQLDDLVKTAENLRESPIRQQIPEKGKQKKQQQQQTSCNRMPLLALHFNTKVY